MSRFVIHVERENSSLYKMRVFASCKKERLQIMLIPSRAFWSKYSLIEANSELPVELGLKIITNLPHQYYQSSSLDFFPIPLQFPIKQKNKQFLIITNPSKSQISRNDKFVIQIVFYKYPDVLNVNGKSALSTCFRKKCF